MLPSKFRKISGLGLFKPKLTKAVLKVLYGLLSQGENVDTGSLATTAHHILFRTVIKRLWDLQVCPEHSKRVAMQHCQITI